MSGFRKLADRVGAVAFCAAAYLFALYDLGRAVVRGEVWVRYGGWARFEDNPPGFVFSVLVSVAVAILLPLALFLIWKGRRDARLRNEPECR
jgi:hypothetical protein